MRIKSILMIVYTVIIIVVVFSLTITASQESFISQTAVFKFLFWETPQFPVLLFIAAAFVIGLFIGLLIAVVDNFHSRKIIKDLRKQLEEENKRTTARE